MVVVHIAQPCRGPIDSLLNSTGENVQKCLCSLLTDGTELRRGCAAAVLISRTSMIESGLLLIQCPPLHWEPVTPLGWEIASSFPGKSNDPTAGLLKSDRFPGTMLEQINLGNCWYLWFNWSYLFLCFSHWVYGARYHFIWGFQVLGVFNCTVALWKSHCKIDP